MKTLIYLVGAICGVAAYMVVRQRAADAVQANAAPAPVEDLAHRLQDAWADHHTVV